MKDIQVWGTPICTWCIRAKKLLENQGFSYEYFDKEENEEKFKSLFPDATTVPQIIFRGEKVGGYEGLVQTFDNQNVFAGGGSF